MATDKWVIKDNSRDPTYQHDDLLKKFLNSHDACNMRDFGIRFPDPGTKSDQFVSVERNYFRNNMHYCDSASLYLYSGKIVYGWVWWGIQMGHPVDSVVYNARDLRRVFPDVVAFLRQEGILEKTWLQKISMILKKRVGRHGNNVKGMASNGDGKQETSSLYDCS